MKSFLMLLEKDSEILVPFAAWYAKGGYDEILINSVKAAFVWGNAGIAQLVEQLICNQQVVGSNPTAGSLNFRFCDRRF
jgi:hypothetical protein